MNKISNLAHALIPWLGAILAMQAPITAFLIDAGAPVKLVDLAFGAVGLFIAIRSKAIDSNHDAATAKLAVAQAQMPTSQMPAPPS